MSNASIEIDLVKLLSAIHSNINQRILMVSKPVAKNFFRELADGKSLPFMEINSPEMGDVSCDLALDHSQFIGTLNFRQFRNALASHMHRVTTTLQEKEELSVFTNEESDDIIFYLPGIIEDGGTMNVLVTGIEQRKAGHMTVRLMFLDPTKLSLHSKGDSDPVSTESPLSA